MIFISSWDDGHPCDTRLANLLSRHGLKGTFYLPIKNCEGRDVLTTSEMREIDAVFEIGSHSRDHLYLDALSQVQCSMQICEGKQDLEDILGHFVASFCYPGGKFNKYVRQSVINAGFSNARTVTNLWLSPGNDVFSIPTTVQFYPHAARVLWSNFIKGGYYSERVNAMANLMFGHDRLGILYEFANRCMSRNQIFHIWGHSWEIDKLNLWQELDGFLSHVASLRPVCMTVSELAEFYWPNLGAGNPR